MQITSHNFILGPVDTDSISICKHDMSPFSPDERKQLLDELNSLLPEKIKMADDGYFPIVLTVKAKNYVLVKENGYIKIKGSALKATNKPPALKEFIKRIIDYLLTDRQNEIVDLYHEYIKEAVNLQDITRWASKATITGKVMDAERSRQQKIKEALVDPSKFQEGDKIRIYDTIDKKLKLQENWDKTKPDHDDSHLMKMVYDTLCTFETIIPIEQFIKYHLKTKRKLLANLV